MTDITINVETWNKARELPFCPKHFVLANTKLTDDRKLWVLERLHGRFYVSDETTALFDEDCNVNIYFEDPQEAVFYELTWS